MSESTWTRRRADKRERLSAVAGYVDGKLIEQARLRDTLEGLLRPGDRVALEGDNQKQADFLSRTLAQVRSRQGQRPAHADLVGVAAGASRPVREEDRRTSSTSPTPDRRVSASRRWWRTARCEIGAIHTYVELYARMFIDLTPERRAAVRDEGRPRRQPVHRSQHRGHADDRRGHRVSRRRGARAGRRDRRQRRAARGSTSPATGSTSWSQADRPFALEPLFTRDPRLIGPVEILKAMIAIRGVYERHEVTSLNHGIGFDTAAIELLLPTYGDQLGLKGKIAKHWTLNPHPTLIPAIESRLGGIDPQLRRRGGMERYTAARPDVFFTGRDGSLRSNRVLCQLAGQYAVDMFIGSSLQIDGDANSSTVTDGRLPGFGGAPNMGHDPHGRRHSSAAWLSLAHGEALRACAVANWWCRSSQTFQKGGIPTFVESLDAVEVGKNAGMPIPPVMIYGDDVSHVVTEEGVAYLYKAPSLDRPPGGVVGDRRRDADRAWRRCGTHGATAPRRVGRLSGGPRYRCAASGSVAARRPQHRGPRRMVRRTLRSARTVSGLVSAMTNAANATQLHQPVGRTDRRRGRRRPARRGAAHAETRAGRRIRQAQPPRHEPGPAGDLRRGAARSVAGVRGSRPIDAARPRPA